MKTKQLTQEQKTYIKSMDGWFKSMDLNAQFHNTELDHWTKTIDFSKKKIALHKEELKHINTRVAIAKKEYAAWKKSNI